MVGDRSEDQEGVTDLPPAGVEATTRGYEEALAHVAAAHFELVLYVAGAAPCSMRAIANIRRLCAEHLPECHELHVVDIYQEPAIAERDGILAVPALIKLKPLPRQAMVGDLTDFRRVLAGLGITERAGGGAD
jgi:circadian clock protein KaiB